MECTEIHKQTQIHTGVWGVMEWFKDTGSVKKDRKRLRMAVPNKIDSTLKIYKHAVATFFLFLTPFVTHPTPELMSVWGI